MDTPDTEAQDGAAFDAVATGRYDSRDAALTTAALRHWLRMVAGSDDEALARMMVLFYIFARISQISDAARDAFAPILRGYAGPHAELAQRLLEVPGDATFPNALAMPIHGPEGLDLLWAEFFVTGDAAPVERIFATLDGEDRIRLRLDAWLHESSLFGGARRRAIAAELAAAGVRRRRVARHQGLGDLVAPPQRALLRQGRRHLPRRIAAPWRARPSPRRRPGAGRTAVRAVGPALGYSRQPTSSAS
jgi:hypothetical protein